MFDRCHSCHSYFNVQRYTSKLEPHPTEKAVQLPSYYLWLSTKKINETPDKCRSLSSYGTIKTVVGKFWLLGWTLYKGGLSAGGTIRGGRMHGVPRRGLCMRGDYLPRKGETGHGTL